MTINNVFTGNEAKLFLYALWLSIFTILANLVEGIFSTILGYSDETIALFGFGLDSFIEVISAVGILFMLIRLKSGRTGERSQLETLALRVTSVSFFMLTAGLVVTTVLNLINGAQPESTRWGIIISLISLSVMIFLMQAKLKVGKRLNSDAIIADAKCTRVCIYMSVVLLLSSSLYSLTGIGVMDTIGALGIAYYSFTEGREAWEKAAGNEVCVCGND